MVHTNVLREWSGYVQWATYAIEAMASNLGHKSWEKSRRRRKFRFAGRTAQTSDGRWSKRLMTWIPWLRPGPDFGRAVGRPKQRWAGESEKHAGGNHFEAALWSLLGNEFVTGL